MVAALSWPGLAHAWQVGNTLNEKGCHERMTAEAIRRARTEAGVLPSAAATDQERAIVRDLQFVAPEDLQDDWTAMSLLIAVRSPDVKGQSLLDTLDITRIHGDPDDQDAHCIRAPRDDAPDGSQQALADCAAGIIADAEAASAALASPDVISLPVFLRIAGSVEVDVPARAVHLGRALHALQDAFSHTYRGEAGDVTTVLNWVEFATADDYDESRDGPPHSPTLDDCLLADPLVQANYSRALAASTRLIVAALDPDASPSARSEAIRQVAMEATRYEPGCTAANDWCGAEEEQIVDPRGCSTVLGRAGGAWILAAMGALLILWRRRIAPWLIVLVMFLGGEARAQSVPAVAPHQEEPGRDVDTPTAEEVQEVRSDKRLGSPWGGQLTLGGSLLRGGASVGVAGRYRLDERWLVGIDAEWNPWVTKSPLDVKPGAINVYATVVRRFPMLFDRVNLRTSAHLGTSILVYDVFGAPRYSTGLFLGISPLGLDFDLGNSWRIVFDPAALMVPMPNLGQIPLVYEQYRISLGISWGA